MMRLNVLFHAPLAHIIGRREAAVSFVGQSVSSREALRVIEEKWPVLQKHGRIYIIGNRATCNPASTSGSVDDVELADGETIEVVSPISGG